MSYSSINHVVLIGRLTRDPELRELPSGHSVCNIRIACNGNRRTAEGEYQDRPHFFDVATFSGLAENVARYMHKGSLVAVAGRLEWNEWETAEQLKRQAVSVVAETVQFLERPATQGEGERSGETLTSGSPAPFGQQDEGAEDDGRELVGAGAGEIDLVF
jgi:single-strand DNA-binding protein